MLPLGHLLSMITLNRVKFRRSTCSPDASRPVGDRAFSVAAAKLWNEFPGDVTASVSLTAFRRQLETFLFRVSYPDS